MKLTKMLALAAGVLVFGASQAYAVPVIDGNVGAGEWANAGYPYYLELNDPNELDNQFDNMDISHVVLLQELGGDANPANDGIYLLVEVYNPPVSLKDPTDDGVPATPTAIPIINMSGDFEGDGVYDIHFRTFNTDAAGVAAESNDVLQVCVGTSAACHPIFGAWSTFSTGATANYNRGNAVEYFFPVGSFGTPNAPFPQSFAGFITFDNGASGNLSADDIVFGQPNNPNVIPEPGTMLLMGSGLLGLAFRRKKQQA
jgi:hypothetical protein